MAARKTAAKSIDNRPSRRAGTAGDAAPAKAPAKELTPEQARMSQVRGMLERYQPQVAELLSGEDPKRFMRTIFVALAQTPKLAECTPTSLVGGMLEVATLKLEIGVLGEGWLLPYWNNRERVNEAQLIVGYRGFMKLARNSGQVGPIQAAIVREGEDFTYQLGSKTPILHTPAMDAEGRSRDWIGAYAYAYIQGFDVPQVAFMSAEEILDIRNQSPSAKKGFGPWVDHEESMWMKTPVRQLAKFLPMSAEMQRAVSFDQLADAGKSQQLGSTLAAFGISEPRLPDTTPADSPPAEESAA